MYYGYHRTSTNVQHLDRGIHEINQYCMEHQISLEKIYTDQETGKNFNRKYYKSLKRKIKENDTVIITELDRLGRNRLQIIKELQWFQDHKVRVMILELPTTLMDLTHFNNSMANLVMDTINKMLIEMYAMMSEAEMAKRVKRQKEGIAAKKARGEWDDYGRPRIMTLKEFTKLYECGIHLGKSNSQIAEESGVSKSTFYKYLNEYKKNK